LADRGAALHKAELLTLLSEQNMPTEVTENHVLGVLQADSRFKAWQGGYIGLAGWTESGRMTFAEVMKKVADSILVAAATEDIVAAVHRMLGRDFNKYSISLYLNRYGVTYDKDERVWKRQGNMLCDDLFMTS
jgi:hypothetical protein